MQFLTRSLALVIVLAAILLAGCGGGGRSGGLARPSSGHRIRPVHAAICGYTAYRTVHDLRTGHRFAGAFNAYLAIHHCRRSLRR